MDLSSAPPSTLGKYQIRGVLGRGAMGTVYDGWDPVIGRRVAIKTVRLLDNADPEALEGLERFKREAQAAGRLSHPNIVGVYDYGETDETAYIVMEFVEGQSLKQRLDARERFPVAETVRIMEQILAGLQFSHDSGVVHRDIKPGNVMLAKGGRVKLADFGIARIESSVMTQDGTMLGTPAYMSPEQLMALTVDARSDLYSAGVVLYQLLTGERPFEGGLTAIIHKALNTVPPRPSEIAVTAPVDLDPVVARAMARRPADRYPDADSFARALRDAFESQGTLAIGGGAWFAMRPSPSQPAPIATAALPSPEPARASPPPAAISPPVASQVTPTPAAPAAAPTPAPTSVPEPAPEPAPVASTPAPPTQAAPAPTASVPPPAPEAPAAASPPQPAPAPASPPQVAAILPPNPAALRDALLSLSLSANCAIPRFSLADDGDVSATGLVGTGAPAATLRAALEKADPGAQISWLMRPVDGPYCDVLDAVRPIALASSPAFGLTLIGDVTRLKDNDPIRPILKLPDFPTHLTVDYFSHDGSVAHLFPAPGAKEKAFAANASLPLGDPKQGVGLVGPPFGTDMILAIASSTPLFAQRRPGEVEQADAYLPALRAALDAARRANAKVTGRALVLETVAK
jgi:serine/threonine protein kinase